MKNIPNKQIYTMTTARKLGWLKGFEPSTLGITIRSGNLMQVSSSQGILDGWKLVYPPRMTAKSAIGSVSEERI